ncbi:uncharacterized protein LOC112595270 isoform X2 [Melanaphis sacchari]|uniref:uncharacterized protein LOC112595270 isoform X2 n=1 Tax=Melanaphis sacchari TaxID=742174 RepID=UPI000DC1338D|nr:uncharacterized protein LOC112595270 isoform X2 [Melanaphis sacchari]
MDFNSVNYICVDNLKLVGFVYDLPLINYAFAMMFATDAGVIPFDAQIEKKLNESDINKQKEIHGETLLGKDKIREYLNQYSNACVQFDSDNINPPVLSPEDYCNALMRERKCIKKLVAYLFLNSKFMI